MPRWRAIAGCLLLVAAAAANAQSMRPAQIKHDLSLNKYRGPMDSRLAQEAGFEQSTPATMGLAAYTQVAPNARLGFHLMNVIRPKLGPEWRTDGRVTRSRKPAVSFTFRF